MSTQNDQNFPQATIDRFHRQYLRSARRWAIAALVDQRALDLVDCDGHAPAWVPDLLAGIWDEAEKLDAIAHTDPAILRDVYAARAAELAAEAENE